MVEIVTHGTLDYTELENLGLTPDDLHVFSSNINPYGPPQAVIDAVRDAVDGPTLSRYPDRLSTALRAAIAAYHTLPDEAVVVGNGTADLMWMIGLLYLFGANRAARRAVILGPTFGEYANVASLVHAPVQHIALPGWAYTDDGRFTPGERDMAACLAEIAGAAPDVVFLCNPNNPTGDLFSEVEIARFMEAAPAATWVIDEAYMEFVETPWSASGLIERQNVIVLRSMTKDFSLGGIRLGYLVATPAEAQRIQVAQSPWNVNALAQTAGEAALRSQEWRTSTLAQLRQDTADLQAQLRAQGWEPRPSTANFFLTPVEDPGDLRAFLIRKGLLIRDCTSFGLPTHFRVATQKPEENALLVDALAAYRAAN